MAQSKKKKAARKKPPTAAHKLAQTKKEFNKPATKKRNNARDANTKRAMQKIEKKGYGITGGGVRR